MIYENFGNQIYNKFNVFGSSIFSITINLPKFKNYFEIIDTYKIYPINDIKLDNGKPRKKAPYWPTDAETKY